MTPAPPSQSDVPANTTPLLTAASPARVSELEGWTLHEHAVAGSTNSVASRLPAWHAVRADVQTAGRGRFQRTWISDKGGLWLSAVVPMPQSPSCDGCRVTSDEPRVPRHPTLVTRHLPLIAGLALCDALTELGIPGFRMRWPNDVLVQDRKLAGLLLDQFTMDRVVVGLGLNVRNQPAVADPALHYQATRLAEWMPAPPDLLSLTALILRHLRGRVLEAAQRGFPAMLPRVNALWGAPRRVQLLLDDGLREGLFTSVDEEGSLLLQDKSGQAAAYHPSQVRHVQEI
jgi:BirA family transcriptional regulator, biotin operon repressor / biotin---[acetyl-CoA-carboxylase] ligase